MDGGSWWAIVHGVAQLDTTEQLHLTEALGGPDFSRVLPVLTWSQNFYLLPTPRFLPQPNLHFQFDFTLMLS